MVRILPECILVLTCLWTSANESPVKEVLISVICYLQKMKKLTWWQLARRKLLTTRRRQQWWWHWGSASHRPVLWTGLRPVPHQLLQPQRQPCPTAQCVPKLQPCTTTLQHHLASQHQAPAHPASEVGMVRVAPHWNGSESVPLDQPQIMIWGLWCESCSILDTPTAMVIVSCPVVIVQTQRTMREDVHSIMFWKESEGMISSPVSTFSEIMYRNWTHKKEPPKLSYLRKQQIISGVWGGLTRNINPNLNNFKELMRNYGRIWQSCRPLPEYGKRLASGGGRDFENSFLA